MHGVYEVRDVPGFVGRVFERLKGGAAAPHLQRRVPVAESRDGDGVAILGDDEVALGGVVHPVFVVEIRVGASLRYLGAGVDRTLVDRDELLVKMIEGGA